MTKSTDTQESAMTIGPISVTDNTGRSYAARILYKGDTYGNGAVWGSQFYQDEVGITIDGLPCTYNLSQIAGRANRIGAALAIDSGQDWKLTEESTLRFFQLADMAAKPEPRYRYEAYRNPHGLNDWESRQQWLVFDKHGIGCFASFDTEAPAKLTTDALNAYWDAR